MSNAEPIFLDGSLRLPLDEPFTRRRACELGVNDTKLHRLVSAGYLRRPMGNLYIAAQVPDSIELRCRMLGLVVPEDAFVCDRTAAWLHLGDDALAPNEHLNVPRVSCFLPGARGRLRNKLTASGERSVLPRDLMVINGVRVTVPLRTGLDLGRLQRSRDMKMWGIDSMLGLGVFTLEELLIEIPRFKGDRGVVMLRVLAPLADPGTKSFGEAALKLRWYDGGLPRPQTQIPVPHPAGTYWLDLGLEDLLFAAEYDGEEWHPPEERKDGDTERRGWMSEMRAWQIEVFVKANVFGPLQDADLRLAREFALARKTFGERTFILL